MTIRFRCQCGSRFNVDDGKRGRKGKCPVCGARLRIPSKGSPNGRSVPATIMSMPGGPPAPPPTPPAPRESAPASEDEEPLRFVPIEDAGAVEDERTETHEPIRHVDALLEDDELEEMEELEADEDYLSVVDGEPPPPEDDSVLAPVDLDGRRTLKAPEKGTTRSFLSAFVYPLSGKGIGMIVLATLIFPICLAICEFALFFGFLGTVTIGAYLGSFYMSAVSETCRGEEVVPDWPDFTNAWNEIFRPYFRLIGATIISFLPAIICGIIAFRIVRDSDTMSSLSEASGSALVFLRAGLVLGAAGVLYLPMAILAVSATDSILAAMPNIVLTAIVRSLLDYVILLVMIVVVGILGGLAYVAVTAAAVAVAGESFLVPVLLKIPFFAINAYFALVLMRMMGLLYRRNAEKIQWGYE